MNATPLTQVLTTFIFLLLVIPAGGATVGTIMSVANLGAGGGKVTQFDVFIGYCFIASTGVYPIVAIISVIASWVAYAGDHYQTAFYISLIPLINIAIFALCFALFFDLFNTRKG